MTKKELQRVSPEKEKAFRETFRLRDDLTNDPEWQAAYEHAAKYALYIDEINAIGPALVRKDGLKTPNVNVRDMSLLPEHLRRLQSNKESKIDSKTSPAKGKIGHLLYSPLDGGYYFFRIYSEDKKSFTDYDLAAEDIKIQIVSDSVVLRESDKGNKLDWSNKVLGIKDD